jgi:hypothetical protein
MTEVWLVSLRLAPETFLVRSQWFPRGKAACPAERRSPRAATAALVRHSSPARGILCGLLPGVHSILVVPFGVIPVLEGTNLIHRFTARRPQQPRPRGINRPPRTQTSGFSSSPKGVEDDASSDATSPRATTTPAAHRHPTQDRHRPFQCTAGILNSAIMLRPRRTRERASASLEPAADHG